MGHNPQVTVSWPARLRYRPLLDLPKDDRTRDHTGIRVKICRTHGGKFRVAVAADLTGKSGEELTEHLRAEQRNAKDCRRA
jgi:hypothetical protein